MFLYFGFVSKFICGLIFCCFRLFFVGKFLNYMIDDGGYVFVGDVYVEIEVMKMVMEFRVIENGW